jgi:hypothetical protein
MPMNNKSLLTSTKYLMGLIHELEQVCWHQKQELTKMEATIDKMTEAFIRIKKTFPSNDHSNVVSVSLRETDTTQNRGES